MAMVTSLAKMALRVQGCYGCVYELLKFELCTFSLEFRLAQLALAI